MALTYSEKMAFGTAAPAFSLPAVDGKTYTLDSFKDSKALLVIFMCNHCPYVQAVDDRIDALAKNYGPKGVSVIGICSNDPNEYPDDNFENMKKKWQERNWQFVYAQDESQEVAKAYQAVCTPDPYVFENEGGGKFALRYHGRIDDNWKDEAAVTRHELAESLDAILSDRPVSQDDQKPAMGCNIKWK